MCRVDAGVISYDLLSDLESIMTWQEVDQSTMV